MLQAFPGQRSAPLRISFSPASRKPAAPFCSSKKSGRWAVRRSPPPVRKTGAAHCPQQDPEGPWQQLPQNGQELYDHYRVEKQVGNAVQPCNQVTGRPHMPGKPAVQHVAESAPGIDHKIQGRKRHSKNQPRRSRNAQGCDEVWQLCFIPGVSSSSCWPSANPVLL